MRPRPATLALLLACTPVEPPPPASKPAPPAPPPPAPPTTRALALPDFAVQIPTAFIPLDPDALASLRAAPEPEFSVAGVRAPTHPRDGMVYLQRIASPRDPAAHPRSVRQTLERMGEDVETRLRDELEAFRIEVKVTGDGLTGWYSSHRQTEFRTAEMRACTRITVTDVDHILLRTVTCIADSRIVESLCTPVLASFHNDPVPALGLDEVLPANAPAPVPLASVTRNTVAGVVFGATPDEFAAACRASGFTVNPVDRGAEEPAAGKADDTGQVAECSGMPTRRGAAFEFGPVVRTTAVFVDARLAVVSIHLDVEFEAVHTRLTAAYPELVVTPLRIVHRIDDTARGDDLLRVGIDESGVPGAREALHFVSERGAHARMKPVAPPP